MTIDHSDGHPEWVYPFRSKNPKSRDLLGGKGAELAEMTSVGLPVPPGFTITTDACRDYYQSGEQLPEGLWEQVVEQMKTLESASGKMFGDSSNPLLVSVRSGAVISMPGMMDTILNLGMNDDVVSGIAARTGNERFALDLYRRFIQMFGNVVLGISASVFEQIIEQSQIHRGVSRSADLQPGDLRDVINRFEEITTEYSADGIPDDPESQLKLAVRAVFGSWNTRRAIDYRNFHRISHDLGTAVNVMEMVYGNLDEQSCTGVLFTRDPSTGEKTLYGEYLVNAQGEDVVSGTATPGSIAGLANVMPDTYQRIVQVSDRLERHYTDVQDVEFTVEQGKLYVLQTRAAQRSAKAAIKLAVDMVREGLITKEEALLRVDPNQVHQLLLPRLDEASKSQAKKEDMMVAVGLGASPGGATGEVVFSADAAVESALNGIGVILVRAETSAEDVHGMLAADGILTSRGGVTSHAAVVARGLGKPCITGAETVHVNADEGYFQCGDVTVRQGERISIDGATGEVFRGPVSTIQPNIAEEHELAEMLTWADSIRKMGVRANADNPHDASIALELGADGIGLCRTEHMFFEPERLALVRDMILAAHATTQRPDDADVQDRYFSDLEDLEEIQVADYEALFRIVEGKPIVIRLLDPPLNEFLQDRDEVLAEVLELRIRQTDPECLAEKEQLLRALDGMRESNPMLGLRGCRLGIIYPDIYAMQMRAIGRAASNVAKDGISVVPEIMVPLVSDANEMRELRKYLDQIFADMRQLESSSVEFKLGTMIEVPRAALTANDIAQVAEFFSFGTNDLTQTTFCLSRDDAEGKFLMKYVEDAILPEDPFQVIDRKGVGRLIEIACQLGKEVRPSLVTGICGEHGGDPASIEFFHSLGLDYVSCSPYRVPVARLAAAQASLR